MNICRLSAIMVAILTATLSAAEINRDQLAEGYITYGHKLMKVDEKLNKEAIEKRKRNLLEFMGKENPLLAPYVFENKDFDRPTLLNKIQSNQTKLKTTGTSLDVYTEKSLEFASEAHNLEQLSDAELIIVHRLLKEAVSRCAQQTEALEFVKQCILQVKQQDVKIFQKITDANILFDVEAKVKETYGEQIKWEDMFGKLSKLSDKQIKNLFKTVLVLKGPGSKSTQTLADKRQPKERKVDGIYLRFEAKVNPKFQHIFKGEKTTGFGVYIIEGKKYWEPFGW